MSEIKVLDGKMLVTVAVAADMLSLSTRAVYELTSAGILERRFVGSRNLSDPRRVPAGICGLVAGLSWRVTASMDLLTTTEVAAHVCPVTATKAPA